MHTHTHVYTHHRLCKVLEDGNDFKQLRPPLAVQVVEPVMECIALQAQKCSFWRAQKRSAVQCIVGAEA
eukprot:1156295-Pelagomonas_calceolata.AAC.15